MSSDLQSELLRRYSRVPYFKGSISLRLQFKRLLWLSVIRGSYLAKRLIDIVAAIILLILLMPLFVIIMVLIYLSSPGPVFYKVTRNK